MCNLAARHPVPAPLLALRYRLCSSAVLELAQQGMRVKVDMKMALTDGTMLDDTPGAEFVCGVGQMLKGVDETVLGMRIGESREVTLEPKDAFGEQDDEYIVEVPLSELPADTKVEDVLSSDGGQAVVVAIKDDMATVDHNHTLAGKTVVFTAKLLEVCEPPALVCDVQTPGDDVTFPKPGDMVTVHYTGTLAESGAEFDSSRGAGGKPFTFTVGHRQVISGWDEGVIRMSLGERSILRIPSALGYGAMGQGDSIPPNSDLVFDIELLKIN